MLFKSLFLETQPRILGLQFYARKKNGLARKCATYKQWNEEMLKKNDNNNNNKQTKEKQKKKKANTRSFCLTLALGKWFFFYSSAKSKVNASRSWASDFGYWWSLLSRDERAINTRRVSLAGNTTSGIAENCYPRVARLPGDSRKNHAFWPVTYFHRKKWLHAFCYYDVISLL